MEENYVALEDIIVAYITAATLVGGVWVYSWTEQSFDSSTGNYVDAISARSGDGTTNILREVNNKGISTPAYAWIRLKGIVGGDTQYEFISPNFDQFPSSSSSSSSSAQDQGVCVVANVVCVNGLDVTRGRLTASVTINGVTYPIDLVLDTSPDACAGESGCGACLQPAGEQPTSWTMTVSGMTGFYAEFNGDWTSGPGIGCFWNFTLAGNPNLSAELDLDIPRLLFIDHESFVEFSYGTGPGPYDCCAPMILTLAGPNMGQAPSVTVVPACGGG